MIGTKGVGYFCLHCVLRLRPNGFRGWKHKTNTEPSFRSREFRSALADAAPRLERWYITAFRPRRTPPNIVEFRRKRVDPKDVQFSLLDNGNSVGIYLFIPGFEEGDAELKQIGYLLLDDTLGEYDVEIRLGLIKMLPPEAHTEGQRFPLFELPARFDQLISRLERRSGKPS
jgi:hypothetical protein